MSDTECTTKDQNQTIAAETRPVPSQAEGDEETIDKALQQREEKERK